MKTINSIKTGLVAVGMLLFFVMAMPTAAHAQTQTNYYTRDQLIAEIQRLLVALAQQEQYRYSYTYQPVYQPTYPYGRVLGATTGGSQVSVDTLRAIDVDEDEATVYGDIDLRGQRYATVWFVYGRDDDDLDDRSRSGRVYRDDPNTFRADLEDLREDTRYYYRAVAEEPDGRVDYGSIRSFYTDDDNGRSRRDDDEPDVETGRASDIDDDRATLEGEVDMNDFRDGRVFFAYGEDEDQIEDIDDDYDEYRDIDEDGDDLQLVLVDSSLDDDADYEASVWGLDDDTEHYFTICVEYEDDDDDETIICGDVENFETDRD